MTLAEAMRKGAQQRPQGYGMYVTSRCGRSRTCALGAAYEGLYGALPKDPGGALIAEFPALLKDGVPCPIFGCRDLCSFNDLLSVVVHLNDDHRWTREAIADWLDTLDQ